MWLEVVAAAFVAQLLVLPGEKVQFIIAGLSTRYDPKVVVAAAGTAFAGWTAVEIVVGEALTRVLPAGVLTAFTAGLFLLFAVLLYRSAPDPGTDIGDAADATTDDDAPATDGGVVGFERNPTVLGHEVPTPFGGFVPIFVMMATGEVGDKTQLVTIGLATTYGAHPGIWVGEMLAIIPVSAANAYVFHRFVGSFDVRKAHFLGAAVFAFFGLDTVLALATGFSVWETVVETVSTALVALV